MKLDKLTAHVRPLSANEAMELGLCMARAWFGRLFGLWFGRVLMVGLVLAFVSVVIAYVQTSKFDDEVILLWFFGLMYFFKPLFEINILLFLSRRLFDETFDDVYEPINLGTLFALCLWYRFSLKRPVLMAVYLLEGQRGKALSSRLSALSRGRGNGLVMHTVAFFVAEWFLYVAGGVFVWEMFNATPVLSKVASVSSLWEDVLFVFLILLMQGVIAVFFVASGFSLYVCQRSLLEGWDIELGFRRLAGRFLASRQGGV